MITLIHMKKCAIYPAEGVVIENLPPISFAMFLTAAPCLKFKNTSERFVSAFAIVVRNDVAGSIENAFMRYGARGQK